MLAASVAGMELGGPQAPSRGSKSRYHSSLRNLRTGMENHVEEPVSKSERKRQMHARQELGAELVALSVDQINAIELPDPLREAVLEARRVTKFEARRRQLQYIGKLMRFVDPEPIRARLEAWKSVSTAETAQLHLIERWRERLLVDEDACTEFLQRYACHDTQRLRGLIRSAREERQAGRPPHNYRALFQFLRETLRDKGEAEG
jgi:ribosome-associated protein